MVAKPLLQFVLDTLRNTYIERVHFRFGPMLVEPGAYRRDVAALIESGRIRLTIDPAEAGMTEAQARRADGSFVIDTARGQPHPLYLSPDYCEVHGGVVYVKPTSTHEYAKVRGIVVHEATHALQDLQRRRLSPNVAEGAAYLAGAITCRLWGYVTPPRGEAASPRETGTWDLGAALWLADKMLDEHDAAGPYTVAEADWMLLSSHVRTVQERRYVFNGI